MTRTDLDLYVRDAIVRLARDITSKNGSHAAGIFNRAANSFESQLSIYTAAITGRTNLHKRTLGALIELLEKHPSANTEPLKTIIASATAVNELWKPLKHGADPPVPALAKGLHHMMDVLKVLP
jgi:hypothetical protein